MFGLQGNFEHNRLFERFQSVMGTETVLFRAVNDLLMASDAGPIFLLTLLYMSTTFDAVDHSILTYTPPPHHHHHHLRVRLHTYVIFVLSFW